MSREEEGEGEERRFLCWRRMGISPGVNWGIPGVTPNKKPGKHHPWFYQTNSHSALELKTRGQPRCKSHIIKLFPWMSAV